MHSPYLTLTLNINRPGKIILKQVILFAFPQYKNLARELYQLPSISPGDFGVKRFPNQEMYITLNTGVKNQDCLILGSISPPDEQLLGFSLLAHTLKKEGAKEIIALLPYLAYCRQDKDKVGESMATPLIGKIFQASGINQAATIDVHSAKTMELFPLPLQSLSPADIFAKEIKKIFLLDATLVAPDEGAIGRVRDVAVAAGMTEPVAYLKKERTSEGIEHLSLQGDVGQKVILIDDILDTGSTLISACELLQPLGVKEMVIMVTHGLFTGSTWQRLWLLGVKNIYTTDSIPSVKKFATDKIKVLSIKPLLKECVELLVGGPGSKKKGYESLTYEG